jgi:tetratricopeptide (TPR) repeat protein
MTRPIAALALVLSVGFALMAGPAGAQGDSDRLRTAKTLMFDRKYAEARQAWQALLTSSTGAEAEAAAYYVARCSENLGENERAFKEYGEYLARRPADRALAEEARTSRVGLAAKLYKAGQRQQLSVLKEALQDPSKTVRYYAAFQAAGLGAPVGLAALPVLKQIVSQEKDDDLVDRARLYILKLDPGALAGDKGAVAGSGPPPTANPKAATWIRVRVYEKGRKDANVSINLPVGLAEMVFKSLPDDAIRELKHKGIDAENFWDRLKKLPPTEIMTIEGEDGEKVQIWLE